MSGLSKIITISVMIFCLVVSPAFAASAEDLDGDGISNTIETELGTDELESNNALEQFTGFASKQQISLINKETLIIVLLIATITAEISIVYFRERK